MSVKMAVTAQGRKEIIASTGRDPLDDGFDVIDQSVADADVGAIVVCMQVADLSTPSVESTRELCNQCEAPVWLALSSPHNCRRWCNRCVVSKLGA